MIYDVFTLLFQVNKMEYLEEMHIKNLKIRSLQMGQFLLENLPRLKKASNWLLDIYGQDLADMKRLIYGLKRSKALTLEYREWWSYYTNYMLSMIRDVEALSHENAAFIYFESCNHSYCCFPDQKCFVKYTIMKPCTMYYSGFSWYGLI